MSTIVPQGRRSAHKAGKPHSHALIRATLLGSLLAVGIASCGEDAPPEPEMTIEEQRAQAEAERLQRIEQGLSDAGISGVTVKVEDTTAYLSGEDISDANQQSAEQIAKDSLGIMFVETDFAPSPEALAAQRAAEEARRRAAAEAQAKRDKETATAAAKVAVDMGYGDVQVKAERGTVTLSGRSNGALEDRDLKAAIAKVDGVRKVETQFTDVQGDVISAERQKLAVQCAESVFAALEKDTIQFESGSTRLTRDSMTVVDDIAAAMKPCPNSLLAIYGHTDNVGSASGNQRISQARAEAVAKALSDRGIDEANLGTLGYGESKPIADNSTAEGRAKNRRIEFKFSL